MPPVLHLPPWVRALFVQLPHQRPRRLRAQPHLQQAERHRQALHQLLPFHPQVAQQHPQQLHLQPHLPLPQALDPLRRM